MIIPFIREQGQVSETDGASAGDSSASQAKRGPNAMAGRKEARFPKSGFGLGAGQGRYFAHREPETPNLSNLP